MIDYENLDYGLYWLDNEEFGSYNETVNFATADWVKLYASQIRLPIGKGNAFYLLGKSVDGVLRMAGKFSVSASFRRVWYPVWARGSIAGKWWKLSVDRKPIDLAISEAGFMPYKSKLLPRKTNDNFLILLDGIYSAMDKVLAKASVAKIISDFYPRIKEIIDGYTPPAEKKDGSNGNRVLVIDCDAFGFKMGDGLMGNKTNPLYLLYLAFLRNNKLSDLDLDMMICSKNLFMKFNPSKMNAKQLTVFKRGLFRIINANLDDYTERLDDGDKFDLKEALPAKKVTAVVTKTVEPYIAHASGSTQAAVVDAVEKKVKTKAVVKEKLRQQTVSAQSAVANKIGSDENLFQKSIRGKLDIRAEKLFNNISTYQALASPSGVFIDDDEIDDWDGSDYDELEDDAKEALQDPEVEEEVLDAVQEKILPLNTEKSPVNSARDQKLREKQKKVVVGKETIEQIISRDAANIPIEVEDKSAVMHTTNQAMKQIRFANFDKTYIDNLYMKDIVACFDFLKDCESPFYVTDVEVRDSSDSQNFKDTWVVKLVDEVGKKSTIRVDIPKFQDDRFMYLNGTRFIILKQNFFNPLVKDTPGEVILTTNFNKITIDRHATKSLRDIERLYALIKKSADTKMFMSGDSSKGNMKYISTLEYDELSRRLFRFTAPGIELYFSRDYIKNNVDVPQVKGNEFFIGWENKQPVVINEDSGLDRQGRTILEIIEQHLPANYKNIYEQAKGPKQSMYAECKLAGQFIPVITALIVWNGLKKSLDLMGMQWKFDDKIRRVPTNSTGTKYIRFLDGVLSYKAETFAELILNGLDIMRPAKFNFNDFESEVCYDEYVYSVWGSYNGINELNQFKQFLVDPITKQVCKDMMLPDTPSGLLIHAVKLLSDNAYVSKASDKSYRVRSIEMIPAILYSELAAQYKAYVKSGRKIPFTLMQGCVIKKLMKEKTVETYSTLNPVVEVSKTHTISTKGYKGSNSVHAYNNEEKRSYDQSSIGKLAISSSPKIICIG